jgi:hypothetical protein
MTTVPRNNTLKRSAEVPNDQQQTPALAVEHVWTLDDELTGEPWPPPEGEGWHVVRHFKGCTLWRRIYLRWPNASRCFTPR